ncbi:hypothetical protein [Sorangium sp. So ce1000]|uniref:hypothetical protein n=1 Tax=Sorangium sp. So ce1000 TaxID=3133325 RepID=UPI003F6072DE
MKKRWLVWMAALGAVSPLTATSPGCSQPTPECTVATASSYPYATKFRLIEGDKESPCARKAGTVQLVGMQVYNPDENGDQIPDVETKLVAIQTAEFGDWYRGGATIDPNPDLNAFGLGAFATVEPDDNGICTVPKFTPAEVVLLPGGEGGAGGAGAGGAGGAGEGGAGGAGEGGAGAAGGAGEGGAGEGGAGGAGEGGAGGAGEGGAGGAGEGGAGGAGGAGEGGAGEGGAGEGGVPPVALGSHKLEWRNVHVYVTAANLGNQFEGEVTYSEESCSATYKVVGLWPTVDCQIYTPNPDPDGDPIPTGKFDESKCHDPLAGISPDLRVKCDTTAGLCVLDSETIPALK